MNAIPCQESFVIRILAQSKFTEDFEYKSHFYRRKVFSPVTVKITHDHNTGYIQGLNFEWVAVANI